MYFHAPCGVVLYFVVCKLYANKEKNISMLKLSEEMYIPLSFPRGLHSLCSKSVGILHFPQRNCNLFLLQIVTFREIVCMNCFDDAIIGQFCEVQSEVT